LREITEDDEGINKRCSVCGISTGDLTSRCLHNRVTELGRRAVALNISNDLEKVLNAAGVQELATGIPGKSVDVTTILRVVTLNPEDAVSEDIIEASGLAEMKRIISEQREFLLGKHGVVVDDIVAATIIAHLYHVKTMELAPVIVQKAPDCPFCLSANVELDNNRDLLYLNPRIDDVIMVAGDGGAVYIPRDEMECAVLVKAVHQKPLIFIYDADRDGKSRLFVFV
jgi:hypothetical protein